MEKFKNVASFVFWIIACIAMMLYGIYPDILVLIIYCGIAAIYFKI